MPYIGTSPSNGVRRIHTYTATASQTTFTGASSEGVTLSYADTNYIDVFQNGVLLGSADYTSTSGTSVVLAQGASADDLIVIVVYDVFSVADTVSKTNGGTFDNGITIDEDGATVLTVDRATSDGAIIDLQKDGTSIGSLAANGDDLTIHSSVSGHSGFRFGAGEIYPTNNSGSLSSGTTSLGNSTTLFNNLYLSSGVFLGGTGSANQISDYEEGTWTLTDTSGAGLSITVFVATYTKIGNQVFFEFGIVFPTTSNGNDLKLSLPFTAKNSGDNTGGGGITVTNSGRTDTLVVIRNSNNMALQSVLNASASNANYSGKQLRAAGQYTVA